VSIEPIEKLADTSGRQRHTRIGGTIVLRLHEDVCVRPFSRERVRQVRRECGDAAVARQVIAKVGESSHRVRTRPVVIVKCQSSAEPHES